MDRRTTDLGNLGNFWPHELADISPAGRQIVIDRLERMGRAEWAAIHAHRWHAQPSRLTAINICLKRERAALAASQEHCHDAA